MQTIFGHIVYQRGLQYEWDVLFSIFEIFLSVCFERKLMFNNQIS